MKEEKHIEALQEVRETIEEALKDQRGVLPRQRRIAAMLSLGVANIIELYFHRLHIIKPGTQIKHNWFKSEEKSLKLRLSGILTKSLDQIEEIHHVLQLAHEIERERDEMVYGAPLDKDSSLKEKIDLFLELKKIIENIVGEIIW
ncbi:MAG: hypothetical protein HZB65_00615 [Candidatus Aenigmarchaeota archaeon]|nr:hypothetical protein [Candidatus Aenigmarchaeota archaeon]